MHDQSPRPGLDRRTLIQGGLLSAAALALAPDLLLAAEGDGVFQAYDKVEPQKFPWGWIRWLMNDKIDPHAEMTFGIVQVDANITNQAHIHPNSAEYLHVISGTLEHRLGDRWIAMKPGDTLRIPKNVIHQARTQGEPCRSIIVYNTGARQMVPVEEKKG